MPNSGTFVLPIGITPARRSSATSALSAVGMRSLKIGDPAVHGKADGVFEILERPRQAVQRPDVVAAGEPRSASSASARHSSSSSLATMALSVGLYRLMRSRCAAITSRAETLRLRIERGELTSAA